MKPVRQDKSWCSAHASVHQQDEGCPHCKIECLSAQISLDYAAKRWPHANRVTLPQLIEEIEELKRRLYVVERNP